MTCKLFSVVLFSCLSVNVILAQDTIRMNEILIDKDFSKKAKLKSITFGKSSRYFLSNIFFDDIPDYYLVDNIPYGVVQQLTLFFGGGAESFEVYNEGVKGPDKTLKTDFEVTLYRVNDEGELGAKINTTAIPIVLDEKNSDAIRKIELDVSKYNLIDNRFFILLKRISATPCNKCNYYLPATYVTDRKMIYTYNNKKQFVALSQMNGLRVKVETLTREYK